MPLNCCALTRKPDQEPESLVLSGGVDSPRRTRGEAELLASSCYRESSKMCVAEMCVGGSGVAVALELLHAFLFSSLLSI